MEESNVRKGNKLKERTSKENNDGKFEDIGEWKSKPEKSNKPSPLDGNGINLQTNQNGSAFDKFLQFEKNQAMFGLDLVVSLAADSKFFHFITQEIKTQ